MRSQFMTFITASLLAACSDDPHHAVDGGDDEVADASDVRDTADTGPSPAEQVMGIPETARFVLPGLHGDVQVVRLESDIPHIHASDEHDLFLANGYVIARDRFVMMDVIRRAGRGRLAALMGDLALDRDMEARGTGVTFVAETLLARLDASELARVQAFCDGINAYIATVKAGTFPVPSEYELMGPLLGADDPSALMDDWVPLDVAGVAAFIVYYASFEGGDVGREAAIRAMAHVYDGAALGDERKAGVVEDIYYDMVPVMLVGSAPGPGLEVGADAVPAIDPEDRRAPTYVGATDRGDGRGDRPHVLPSRRQAPVSTAMLERARARLERFENRFYRDPDHDFGSNEWAVMGKHGKDGVTLLAADGHLALDIPAFFYQIGLDTSVFGGTDFRQKGLVIPGFPQLAVGTNGKVAWTQTQASGDITDWYSEQIELDANGLPAKSYWHDAWHDLVAFDESYDVRDVPTLNSVGRTETWKRWTTFDGRWLADIEGRPAADDEVLLPGEAIVTMQGDRIVPGDVDDDGIVSAVSFDYTGFDMGNLFRANWAWGTSKDVWDFLSAMRYVTTYSQNMAVADRNGNVLYSGYQTVPCRSTNFISGAHGDWITGEDPRRLLDGTRMSGFIIPLKDDQTVDEEAGKTDARKCVVPFDQYPQSVSPDQGYVVNANNDPGRLTFDNSVTADAVYIGGPWDVGFRAHTITRSVEKAIEGGTADVAGMAAIQANHDSRLAELFHDYLAQRVAGAASDPLYVVNATRIDDALARLAQWKTRGYQAESGVETFYASPSATEREDAIATSIWGTWFPRVLQGIFDDEPVPGDVWQDGTSSGRVRLFLRMLSDPQGLASYVESTGESAFCDVLGTEAVETCDALIVKALVDALDFLASAGEGDSGGFGTADPAGWLWGLRHQVRFGSLLANQIGQNELFDLFLADFRVTTALLPLADDYPQGDPRAGLTWFPRHGDQWGVDAANPGFSGRGFGYSSGPVMRMVVGFMPDGSVVGQNIIPGGQSGRPGSPYFGDQAALWLGNNALPLRYSVPDMVAGARGREVLTPAPSQR